MNTKRLLRIIIPIFIVVVIVVIWTFKNLNYDEEEVSRDTSYSDDFVLKSTSVDLDNWKEYNLPIIIDFGSDSCIPCLAMAPVLETMNSEMQGKAIIKFVDVWKYQSAAYGFPIQVIPTQFFYTSDGKPYVPSEDIQLEFDIYNDEETGEHLFTAHVGALTEEEMRKILADMGVDS